MSWLSGLLHRLRGRVGSADTNVADAGALTPTGTQVPPQWLIVGLGNPGEKYSTTRHNVGYWVVDELLVRHDGRLRGTPGVKALTAPITSAQADGWTALLVRSTTYMNESGLAVAPQVAAHSIPSDHLIVIHDELDLPAGKVKIRVGGNENGHNGLKSLSAHLGTRDYVRIRVGIGRPPGEQSVIDHVLEPLDQDSPDRDPLEHAVATAADAVELIITRGVAGAQNEIHRR